jgi:hypothetical protein
MKWADGISGAKTGDAVRESSARCVKCDSEGSAGILFHYKQQSDMSKEKSCGIILAISDKKAGRTARLDEFG